ncbi:MAG: hypothetical protein AAB225_18325, partial [Acidobacteriota bacterium]
AVLSTTFLCSSGLEAESLSLISLSSRQIDRTGILEVRRRQMDKSNDPRHNFDADPSFDEIIAQQGKGPIVDLSDPEGTLAH